MPHWLEIAEQSLLILPSISRRIIPVPHVWGVERNTISTRVFLLEANNDRVINSRVPPKTRIRTEKEKKIVFFKDSWKYFTILLSFVVSRKEIRNSLPLDFFHPPPPPFCIFDVLYSSLTLIYMGIGETLACVWRVSGLRGSPKMSRKLIQL